jgi:hypothetical protein
MKKYLILLFIIINCFIAKAQVDSLWQRNDSIAKAKMDTLKQNFELTKENLRQVSKKINTQFELNNSGVLDPFVYNKFLAEKFTYLSFERGALASTNSASLDLSDNETQLKLTLAKRFLNPKGRINTIISAGVKAKLGDGIAELFKGNTATTGTTLFLNFASLGTVKFRTVLSRQINGKTISTPFGILKPKLKKLQNGFNEKYIEEFNFKYDRLYTRLKEIQIQFADGKNNAFCCAKLRSEKKDIEGELVSLLAKKDTSKQLLYLIKTDSFRIAQLVSEICLCDKAESKNWNELYREKEDIEKQLADIGLIGKKPEDIAKEAEDKYQADRYELYTKSAPWDWYKLRWFSGGITYTRDAYTTYDNTLSLNKRFGSKDFDSWGLKVTSNWYQEKSQKEGFVRAWYANISYEPSLINSYSNIASQDMLKNIIAESVVDTTYIFQTSKKAKDISNIPYTTSWKHSLSGAFTAMFFEKKNVGINLLFQSQFSKLSNPVFNSHAGLIFSLVNSDYDPEDKKSKTNISFELFLNFPDMSDTGGDGKSAWQKRVIGISTNIPFNKIFLK